MKKKSTRGRKPNTLTKAIEEGRLPENWKEIIILKSINGCSEEEIRRDLCLTGGRNVKNIVQLWYALKERETEFQETILIGKTFAKAWWIEKSKNSLNKQFFQGFTWFANMKNRFGWVDKTEIDHGLTDEYFEKLKGYSPEQIAQRVSALIGDDGSREIKRISATPSSS